MVAPGAVLTMSSREIADLVESRQDDVKRSIERIAAKGVFTLPPLAEVSNTGRGPKTIGVYCLDKRSSLIVVAQLCPEFTARIVDRWQELEAQVAQQRSTGHGQPLALSQMFAMLSEQAGKIEQELRRQAKQIPHSPQLIPASARLCFYDRPNLAAQKIAVFA